jgi:hypothetical protein
VNTLAIIESLRPSLDNAVSTEEESTQMKTLIVAIFCIFVFSWAVAQGGTASTKPSDAQGSAQAQMPPAIETALKKYVAAYERRSEQDLLAVWPDLQNQKKEFGKIKQHFGDPNVSNEHMSLRPLETQMFKDDAVVQCERIERFSKTETTQTGGDLIMNRSPAQSPPVSDTTKPVTKSGKVWVKLHKNQDDWVILSVSEKPSSF